MKCHYHPDLDSTNACSVCSRFLCGSCSHQVKGRIYCQDCLVQGAELAAIARAPGLANYSPARAALFALIPGIGAVYNRQYTKALAHLGVFAALIITSSEGHEIFGFAAFAFWVFTVIDAYRSAEEIVRRGVVNREPLFSSDSDQIKLPIWGGVLMLLGLLFFMSNLGAFSLRSVVWFTWPLLFVGAGLYLILTYWFKDDDKSNKADAVVTHQQPEPPPPPELAPDGTDENPEHSD